MSVLQAESATAIVQRALGLAEARNRFDSLEDGSDEAREGRLRYDIRRRCVIEALDWNFARRRKVPAAFAMQSDDAYPEGLAHAFAIPAGALRILRLTDGDCPVRWIREDRIYADAATVQVVFTIDEENAAIFPPIFTQALEFLLASEFAMIYARSINRSQAMLSEFRRVMQDADAIEGMERSDDYAYAPGTWTGRIETPWFGVSRR